MADIFGGSVLVLNSNGPGFDPPATVPISGGSPTALAIGNLNLDADPDVVAADSGSRLTPLRGAAGTGFAQAASATAPSSPNDVVAADFTSDGRDDAATSSFTDAVGVATATPAGHWLHFAPTASAAARSASPRRL